MTRAFTLIELLVVITVIVVLLALLAPALDQAIESAERVRCAAQLHAWGLAIPQYALDHRRKLMSTSRHFGSQPYPNLPWARNEDTLTDWATGDTKSYDWSAERMKPYIGGVDLENNRWSGAWYCPSNTASLKDQNNESAAVLAGWFVSDYSYFARADIWGAQYATRPQDLTERELSGGRLLMADAIYRWNGGGNGWWFNHSEDGHSTHDPAWGGPVQFRPHTITGTNQLFGDGAVTWKDRARFNPEGMNGLLDTEPWVTTNPLPQRDGNINFY